jgi:hypothetical protein
MPQVGFEPRIPVFERARTVHALESAATKSKQVSECTEWVPILAHSLRFIESKKLHGKVYR